MRRFGLIGDPIDHSGSPELFRRAYGGKFSYELIEGADFLCSWNRFVKEYDGINITAPFKELAMAKADILSEECRRTGAANVAVKTEQGIKVYNSDYYAVRKILAEFGVEEYRRVTVIGFGGAGKAAFAAAQDSGYESFVLHHDELADGIDADIVIYTLPCRVTGVERISCKLLIESNYRDPSLRDLNLYSLDSHRALYVGGEKWLIEQARKGFFLLTGEGPDLL